MEYIVNCFRTKLFVRIKANFGIYKIRNRQIILYCYESIRLGCCFTPYQRLRLYNGMFNDTSRYLNDIFTIVNPEFKKYIPDIYPAELK